MKNKCMAFPNAEIAGQWALPCSLPTKSNTSQGNMQKRWVSCKIRWTSESMTRWQWNNGVTVTVTVCLMFEQLQINSGGRKWKFWRDNDIFLPLADGKDEKIRLAFMFSREVFKIPIKASSRFAVGSFQWHVQGWFKVQSTSSQRFVAPAPIEIICFHFSS